MKAIIVGGGIGGLVTALCLGRMGWKIEILEQAAVIDEVGAGIQLGPNAMRVMATMDLDSAILEAGFLPHALEMRDFRSGRSLLSTRLGDDAIRRWGAPYVQIHRADLIDILLSAAIKSRKCKIYMGVQVTGFSQNDKSVEAIIEGKQNPFVGDILVGADGLNSNIRKQIAPEENPRFTGQIAWRTTIPVARFDRRRPPPSACAWLGQGRHAVTYLVRGGNVVNFVGVVERDDLLIEDWNAKGNRDDVLKDFGDAHPVIRSILEQADTHHVWALYDRKPLRNWSNGRAVLLGDACHPMLPFLAQGAAMAIEDAWVLANCLKSATFGDAFSRYQTLRSPRTARVQAASRSNAAHFHGNSPLIGIGRSGAFKALQTMRPNAVTRQLDWIYGNNIVGNPDF